MCSVWHDDEIPVGMLGTQDLLVELAHAGAWHLVHERPVLGDPPTRDLVGAIGEEPLRMIAL